MKLYEYAVVLDEKRDNLLLALQWSKTTLGLAWITLASGDFRVLETTAAQLASEPMRPAYLIAGPETLVVLEAADAVRAAAREQGIGDREVYDIEGRDPDWDSVAAAFAHLTARRRLMSTVRCTRSK